MKFANATAELFIPDGKPVEEALKRTTDLGICAHQDDLEILAYPGILRCFGQENEWFGGVCVTNGAGSPRDGLYAAYTDEEMRQVRRQEQKKAAVIGEYSMMALLDYPSSAVKDPANQPLVEDLKTIVTQCRPRTVWTHNLADKHDTHVGVALRVIRALREVDERARPDHVYGVEVWRDLDWLVDSDKKAFDVAAHENLAAALLGVFDSQIAGGKRYDLATLGRRRAHATYHASHGTDDTTQLVFGMDLTPLVQDPTLDVREYVLGFVQRLADDIADRIKRFS
ncbi:MAG: PIG-L deacetylase family protein [Armatimonadota bacterium]|jgi:LmbE family N-acetylglucosaminyl deacetylase